MNYFLVDFENVKCAGLDGIEKLDRNDVVIIFYSNRANTLTFDLHEAMVGSSALFVTKKVSVGDKNALDFQLSAYLGFLIRDTLWMENGEISNRYFIVSEDKGYHYIYNFLQELGIKNVRYCKAISKGYAYRETAVQIKNTSKSKITNSNKYGCILVEERSRVSALAKMNPWVRYSPNLLVDRGKMTVLQINAPNGTGAANPITNSIEEPKRNISNNLEKLGLKKHEINKVFGFIEQCKTRQEVNNNLIKEFKNTDFVGRIFTAIRPLISDKKGA